MIKVLSTYLTHNHLFGLSHLSLGNTLLETFRGKATRKSKSCLLSGKYRATWCRVYTHKQSNYHTANWSLGLFVPKTSLFGYMSTLHRDLATFPHQQVHAGANDMCTIYTPLDIANLKSHECRHRRAKLPPLPRPLPRPLPLLTSTIA